MSRREPIGPARALMLIVLCAIVTATLATLGYLAVAKAVAP